MNSGPIERGSTVVGALALATVPVVIAAVPFVPLAWLVDAVVGLETVPGLGAVPGVGAVVVGVLAAAVVGPATSIALGPILVDRRIERLPAADLDDRPAAFIDSRVDAIAESVGIDPPPVTAVRAEAANVAVADGYRGPRLVVSTRLLSLPAADRDAALRHALVRLRTREAAFTTAVLPALVVVEWVTLFATLLVGRRSDRSPADRRVNRIHGYEPDRERIPAPAYAAAGLVVWLVALPAWVPAVVGDRLFVAGRRRAADAAVARVGEAERDGLANAVGFADEAAGAADWPPLLDRLSLVSMADDETGRVRGTSRQEARIRLARLRSKRTL
ncbi:MULTISPECIES: hypothetical protein [Haloferacaceae]|uniref:Peptidase M48 domain-containing protein n=1 Tax=Halorubrum glutamatedens TaxID=2707018 RepID=A0ABD5QVY9_9EURY|nr:hypothetical protein [Halobellus captivus]